ncbi:MAG: TIGR02679 family protein [bacterium]|nr:TIGR02679 family protein [bacterium]
MRDHPVPDSLLDPDLAPLWSAARRQLDRFGTRRRGTIARPLLNPSSTLTLESLLGHPPTSRLDLAELEESLVRLNVGENLCDALTRLAHPPSENAAQRRAARLRSREARDALARASASWEEPWASKWADEMVRTGVLGDLDSQDVRGLTVDVRRFLDHIGRVAPSVVSRTELAATLFGSAHALDEGEKRAAAITQALRYREEGGFNLKRRALWEVAGILADRVSAPVLTWSLPAVGGTVLDEQTRSASAGGLPLHISLFALHRYPITVPQGTQVLVVENPRLVEAAAERRLPSCVITSNGNPSTAVTTLLQQLRESGASIWYHGDFDAAGLGICRRMYERGATPWMMGASDYEDAIHRAEQASIRLERDPGDCGATPWDPELQAAFRRHQRVIHEEFVLDCVLSRFSKGAEVAVIP